MATPSIPLSLHLLICNHMVTHQSPIYQAIADPTRRAILDLLRRGDLPAGDIARRFPVSRPAVSRHLRVLRGAGLVREQKISRARRYSLVPEPLVIVDRWLASYKLSWGVRLQHLKRVVESGEGGG